MPSFLLPNLLFLFLSLNPLFYGRICSRKAKGKSDSNRSTALDQRTQVEVIAKKIEIEDPASAIKLRSSAKLVVLQGLRELSQGVQNKRVNAVQKSEVDAVHDAIEGAALINPRPAEDMLQSGLNAFRSLDPNVKTGILAGSGILGLLGLRGFLGGMKERVLDAKDYVTEKGGKAVKGIKSIFVWLLKQGATIGIAALGVMGLQRMMSAPKQETKPVA